MIKWQNMFYEDDNTQFKFPLGELFALKVSGENTEHGNIFKVYPAELVFMNLNNFGTTIYSGCVIKLYGLLDLFFDECEYLIKNPYEVDLVTYLQEAGSRYQWCPWDEYYEKCINNES